MARRQISPERQGLYYMGMGISALGFVVFLTTFLTMGSVVHSGSPFSQGFNPNPGSAIGGIFAQAVIGMGMIAAGQFMMRLARVGAAGAGLVLDPQQQRQDMEPWSRMGGGMLKDALDEAGVTLGKGEGHLPFDEQLRRLHKLRQDGLISQQEFAELRQRILKEI